MHRNLGMKKTADAFIASSICSILLSTSSSAFGLTSATDSDSAVQSELALSIGRTASWPSPAGEAVSVSNGAIVRVADQGKTLKITGLKLGTAVLKTKTKELEILVLPEASYRFYAGLAEAIEGRRGLSISAVRGKLEVRGRLLRAEDWAAIGEALQEAKPGSFSFRATLEDEVRRSVEKDLIQKLREVGLPQVNLRFQPEAVATVGVEPKDAKERAEKILAPYGFRVESNASVLTLEPLVRVKILVAEVTRTFSRNLGIKLPNAITGQLLPQFAFDQGGSPFSINAAEETGDLKVLASPTLLCRSGKEAEFLAGGEFPIKLSSLASAGVTWKKYGVLLKIKPLADYSGRMSIAIETEVSTLNSGEKADGLPSLLTNRMQTHFDLSQSRTIALSGLIKSSNSRDSSGIPGLRNLPILGPLFSSRGFSEARTELLIFVTPDVPSEVDAEVH